MNKTQPLWGERHNGILVDPEKNKPLYEKIFRELSSNIKENDLTDAKLSGRIKDAGMLAGKTSRCVTVNDFLTVKYEEIGFRIVTRNFADFVTIRDLFSKNSDFVKDYVTSPRQDGLILGVDPKLCYRAFHIYTSNFFGKPIEIQLMTERMLKMDNLLADKYGPYWKQESFKKKRIKLGDDR